MNVQQHILVCLAAFLALSGWARAEDVASYAEAVSAHQKARVGKSTIKDADMELLKAASAALKEAMPSPGLKVGDKAPDFTLDGANGQKVTLSVALKEGPVILTFYRGAWCPYCNIQLQTLSRSLNAFTKYEARVIAITPQTVNKSEAQLSGKQLGFPLLSDRNNDVMKAYRVHFELPTDVSGVYVTSFGIDLAAFNGPDRRDLPVPATFVIAEDGIIKAAFADTNYKERMEPSEILKALQSL